MLNTASTGCRACRPVAQLPRIVLDVVVRRVQDRWSELVVYTFIDLRVAQDHLKTFSLETGDVLTEFTHINSNRVLDLPGNLDGFHVTNSVIHALSASYYELSRHRDLSVTVQIELTVIGFCNAQKVRRVLVLLDNDVSGLGWDGSNLNVPIGSVVVVCEIALEWNSNGSTNIKAYS